MKIMFSKQVKYLLMNMLSQKGLRFVTGLGLRCKTSVCCPAFENQLTSLYTLS